jgi:hypothetical protein
MCTSVKQTPLASILTNISPAFGLGRATVVISSGAPYAVNKAALMVLFVDTAFPYFSLTLGTP